MYSRGGSPRTRCVLGRHLVHLGCERTVYFPKLTGRSSTSLSRRRSHGRRPLDGKLVAKFTQSRLGYSIGIRLRSGGLEYDVVAQGSHC